MLAFLCLSFLPSALSAPLFGLDSSEATGAPTPVSLDTVNTTLQRPAQFARAAYCPSASITAWTCGTAPAGGMKGLTPFYFIAHDTVDQSLVVAHEGTDPKNMGVAPSVCLKDIDTTRIPQAAGKGVQVHSGFQATFQRTADGLLAGVKTNLASTGVKKVVVTGHSLGAVGPSVDVVAENKAWADFLDSNVGVTFVTNQNDPVPTSNLVACPGQDNKHCATGNSLLDVSISNHLG
ncbi:alpha/beta-hydrolase [Mycena belliarum]|uniref:Alpha/beta-hydrolase n=1 Tax=Mycena belliarum TaxID=1033014 RepID=A0AAD6XHV9_9AGAR|nr:alpha/beta-hydrolase [Mycena belliae]